jgi:hypothetical protein
MPINILTKSIIIITLLFSLGCGSADENKNITLFEDVENGLSENWYVSAGNQSPRAIRANNGSNYCVELPTTWNQNESDGYWNNPNEYRLTLNSRLIQGLSLDLGGTGKDVPHYVVGVKLNTNFGVRTLLWNSWYNHHNLDANYKNDAGMITMVFPSPIEMVRGFGFEERDVWSHFDVNLASYLHQFEPKNDIRGVYEFIATGGILDNISLY